ncbi:MAG: hypothetical protein ABIV63_03555 [Caldimonas sp.]
MASERLRAHSGSSVAIDFTNWPKLLPELPVFAFRITPAGLVEWLGDEPVGEPDLRIGVDASNPVMVLAQTLFGTRPQVTVTGDATFASDINWLIENLRWDVQDDLARLVGAGPAQQISRMARVVAQGLREAVGAVRGLVGKASAPPGSPEGPPTR